MMRIEEQPKAFTVGDAVLSVAGRDKTKVYAVVGITEKGRVLCKGESRTKEKNPDHLRYLGKLSRAAFDDEESVTKALAEFKEDFSVLKQSYYKPKKRRFHNAER